MGSKYLTDLADVLRSAGVRVTEYSGWQTRARGSGGYDSGRPTHVMVHHTASPPSWDGQKDASYCATGDEDAPLSNLYIDRSGLVWVLAAGATNTNGSGQDTWGGGVPENSMNSYAIGIEAGNNGVGESWPTVQQDAYVKMVRALMAHYNIPINHVRSHFEWAPDRKTDPAGQSRFASGSAKWNMNAFRNECSEAGDDDMPLTQQDIDKIAKAVWEYMIGDPKQGEDNPAGWRLKQIQGMCRTYMGGFQDSAELPDRTLLQQIHANTKK
jgi:N-acetylmuramoyl-L-alanine amidase